MLRVGRPLTVTFIATVNARSHNGRMSVACKHFLCSMAFWVGLGFTGSALAVDVHVDVSQNRHPISPNIYGWNAGASNLTRMSQLKIPTARWGFGNPSTRYNWKTQVANRASDYFFENIPGSNGDSDVYVATAVSKGILPIIPITTIGWIAKGTGKTCSYSVAVYGAQSQSDGDCGNGRRSSDGAWLTADPSVTSFASGSAWSAEWVGHLLGKGMHFYQLDNEPGIWNSTHHDVHPNRTTYDEMKSALVSHGSAIKGADPQAQILGPVSWGWTEYFYLSYLNGSGNNPDHDAHGDFIPWYLNQAKNYESAQGVRILDYLDLHYYPQNNGIYSGNVDDVTNAARLKSTRSLWDASYSDPSWIGTPIRLIPRMRDWVGQNYPGTKTAITEYSFGAPDSLAGAITQADVLGIFGREGLDLATLFWTPQEKNFGENAFSLYRDYDGAGAQFGSVSILASTSGVDTVTAYASEVNAGKVTVVLINKTTAQAPVHLTLAGVGVGGSGTWRAFAFGQGGSSPLSSVGTGVIPGLTLDLNLPSYTAELIEYTADASAVVFPPDGGLPDAGTLGPVVSPPTPSGTAAFGGCSSVGGGTLDGYGNPFVALMTLAMLLQIRRRLPSLRRCTSSPPRASRPGV